METTDSAGLIDDSSWVTQKLWPRRLLEVSTMTSYERQPGNVYAGETEPKYSIVSYTWGRYTVPDGQRLHVRGITWKTPAIDQSKFSIEDFSGMLKKAAGKNRFVWVDIACIDQEDCAVKMEEVGRQAGIFANADKAFVWLWGLPSTALQLAMSTIVKYGCLVGEVFFRDGSDAIMPADIHSGVNRLLDDPWFTSLWTLQEAFLRADAIFLAKDAQYVRDPRSVGLSDDDPSNTVSVGHFTHRLWATLDQLENCEDFDTVRKATTERIYQAGYGSLPSGNPNTQFGWARFRETTYDVDRVYGIMAAYNISVGAAAPGADSKRVYALSELEEELAIAINAKSALLGQLFVHLSQPCVDKTWQITQESRVPTGFGVTTRTLRHTSLHSFTVDDCVIRPVASSTGKTLMRIEGPICSLVTMVEYWVALYTNKKVILDDYLVANDCQLSRSNQRGEMMGDDEARIKSISSRLFELFGPERISVLRLGMINGELEGPYQYGLLLLHDGDRQETCQRLGICSWNANQSTLNANESALKTPRQPHWGSYQGLIL